ncbi:MAG TPA: hypothetical protein VMZ28_02645 [Kofleriaceae bacterium]|nr:hypothetical protein [Kofleriaceae bacterium]
MTVLGLLLCSAGCALDGDGKDSCVTQDDCVDGYTCVDRVCEGPPGGFGGGGDGGDDGDDDGPGDGEGGGDWAVEEFGTVADISAATLGLTAVNDYDTLIALTSVDGGLGCALVGDEDAAPGGAAAMLSLKPDADGGDDRCPDGTYGLLDDVDDCGRIDPVTGLDVGCAVYRAWDASGEPSALRLATGGYVTITATPVSDEETSCDVELSVSFAGGVTIEDSFSFSYSPLAPDGAFCQH